MGVRQGERNDRAVGAGRRGVVKRQNAVAVLPPGGQPRRIDRLRVDVLVKLERKRAGRQVDERRAAGQRRRGRVALDGQRGGIRRIDGARRVARQVGKRARLQGQPQIGSGHVRGNCGRLLGGRQRDGDRLRRAGGPHRSSGARGRARAGERGEHRDSAAAAAAAVDQPQPRQLHVRRAHVFGKAQDQRAVVQVQGRGAGQAGRRRVALDAHAPPRHLGDAVARKVPDRALADAQEQLPALGGRGAVRQHGLGPLGGRQHHHGGIRRGALPGRGAGQAGKSPRRPAPASAAGRRNADLRRVDPCRIDRLGKPQAELAGVQVQHGDHRGRQRGRVGVARDVELHVGSPAKPVARQVADCAGLDVQADGRGRRVGGGNSRKVGVRQAADHHRRAVGALRRGACKRRPIRGGGAFDYKPRRVDGPGVDVLVEYNGERPGGKVEQGERIRPL